MPVDTLYTSISHQVDPLLKPLFHPQLQPRKLVLITTPEMQTNAVALENAIDQADLPITVSKMMLSDKDNLSELMSSLSKRLQQDRADNKCSIFNATGGTKPLSILGFQVFFQFDLPVFYIDGVRVQWLHRPIGGVNELHALPSLPVYLTAHDITIRKQSYPPQKDQQHLAMEWFARNNETHQSALSVLNGIALNAKNTLSAPLNEKNRQFPELMTMLDDLQIITRDVTVQPERVQFFDEHARLFANGAWLEAGLHSVLTDLSEEFPQLHGVAANVEFQRSGKILNEIDAVCLNRHQLCVFECKTGVMKPKYTGYVSNAPSHHAQQTSVADMLFKLKELGHTLGGNYAKCIFVSAQPLESKDVERAKIMGITVVHGNDLMNLRDILITTLRLQAA